MYENRKDGIYHNGEILMKKGGLSEEKANELVKRLNEKEKGKEKNTSQTTK